jgi:demethylmenaquinone methyltransferase/2-methoxy-6-polyprenyl-1,4-benzoquinol methylase
MVEMQDEAKRRYVADLFARIAPRYDLMNTMMTAGMHHRWRKVAARAATQGLEGVALDVATGTGDLAFTLARSEGIKMVVGLDLLPEMVARANSKAHLRGLAGRAQFTVGDALSLPFREDTFACATSGWGLRNMPEPRSSLEEMVRVVAPGGRVASLESMRVEGGPLVPVFRLFFHQVVPLMGQIIARDRPAYTYLPQSVDRFLSVDALARLFEEVGLEGVGYTRMALGAVAVHWGTKPTDP